MKKIPLNIRFVVFLALSLLIIILVQSILEYRSSRKAVMDLLQNQAASLVLSVARASEKGLVAYEMQQDKIAQHLRAIAGMAAISRVTDRAALDDFARRFELSFILILDSNRAIIGSAGDMGGWNIDLLSLPMLAGVLDGHDSVETLGFINSESGRPRDFAVAVRGNRGVTAVAGIDADELLNLRRAFGAGSVIDDISHSPGVRYAGIMRGGSLMAASSDFPSDSLDSWYNPNALASGDIRTRIRDLGEDDRAFEAIGPFQVSGRPFGEIVIGMDTEYLGLLTLKLRRDILWRGILFLFVAVTVVAGVSLRQNYRLLSQRLIEMQEDVQRLEADRALSAKLVAMGELARGVAHEIRNPLNAIAVIIQRLQREFSAKEGEAEYRELTGVIRRETERINASVEHFLTLARPPVLHKSRADINDCIGRAYTLFEPHARAQGCCLTFDGGEVPPIVCDPELMHQAIMNLVENALAALGPGGKIEIKTRRKGKHCIIEIGDSGPGIPDDRKERVFDLYFTTKPAGTGMGLPTVLQIVKEHGGRIELVDRPGGGALFRLELPIE
jgi:signal transduction histidine kinase